MDTNPCIECGKGELETPFCSDKCRELSEKRHKRAKLRKKPKPSVKCKIYLQQFYRGQDN